MSPYTMHISKPTAEQPGQTIRNLKEFGMLGIDENIGFFTGNNAGHDQEQALFGFLPDIPIEPARSAGDMGSGAKIGDGYGVIKK